MILPRERTTASFGIGFIASLVVGLLFFVINENLQAGYYCLPFGLLAGFIYERFDKSINNTQKYKNYFFSILGGILPAIVAGF
jgi:hypothetical protein